MTDEEAAKAWANERCPGQDECDIVWSMCYEDFLAGVEYGRQIVEWRERAAWEAARAPRKIEPVFGVPGYLPVGQRYATFEDWKKEKEQP